MGLTESSDKLHPHFLGSFAGKETIDINYLEIITSRVGVNVLEKKH